MNTSLPLLNVITGSQAATGSRSGNPADSFTADAPFNQVLNSQVNSRNQEQQSQAKPQAPQPPAATNQAAQTDAAKQAAATKTESKQDVADQSKEKDEDSDDTTTAASAELLALVANIAQNAVKPVGEGKSENTEADLLAQSRRGGATLSLADQQALMADGKQGKIDLAGLQDAMAANKLKQEGRDLSRNASGTEANPLGQESANNGKSDKPALDLSADTKAAPKEDASALAAARAQTGKVTAEAVTTAKHDLPQTTPAPIVVPAIQQTLAASQPQAVFASYTDKVQPNVGSAGWDQAVGSKITWMVSAGMQSASLSLNPPDLGPMQVVLNVHNQQADATFITAQPEVKQALEAAMPKLREMMDQAGIQLGQATVNTGMPNQQQGNTGQQQGRSASASGSFGKDQEGELAVNATTTTTATTSGLGLVDTFA